MINRGHAVLFIPLLALFVAQMSCQSKKTPVQVSEHFWLGMKTKNVALVKKYSLVNSIDETEDLAQFDKITDISFGKIIIDGAVAEIETSITATLNQKQLDINLKTYLENHSEVWKVNYRKTVLPLAINQNMAKAFGDIGEITEELSGQIEESVEEIKGKVMPEIKSEIERTEKDIMKKIPELKSMFDEFLRELEKSIEDLMPEEEKEEPKTQET